MVFLFPLSLGTLCALWSFICLFPPAPLSSGPSGFSASLRWASSCSPALWQVATWQWTPS